MIDTRKLLLFSPKINHIILLICFLFVTYLLIRFPEDPYTNALIHKIIRSTNGSSENFEETITNNSNQIPQFPSYVCDEYGPPNTHSSILRSYCDKVPIPRNGWKRAQNYNESDIAFLIFTAAIFYNTRATATRDTWLSRVTNKYFLSATPYPWLPLTIIKGAGENRLSNMKKIFYGLQIIYIQQQSVSEPHMWYYLAGCDTFVNVPHMLKRLDAYDYTKPFLIGGHSGSAVCPDGKDTKTPISYPSGGAGFFISSKLLELMMPHLSNYVENIWPSKSKQCGECSDIALTCLIHKLGINLTKMPGFWSHNPDLTIQLEGRQALHSDKEPNNFHYVSPNEMYDLDEFYSFQYIDRLINDENWIELSEYIRTFVSSHYEILRIKRSECKLPKAG